MPMTPKEMIVFMAEQKVVEDDSETESSTETEKQSAT